ncbi:MAG TPA: GldG family protein [Gallionellaceae bacterium]|nr:GldG family protein [Gallionellaceae bacterium]
MKRLLPYSLQLKNIAFSLLLLGAAIALYQLIALHPLHWDATQNASNSLAPGSVDTLQQLHGAVNITMYANSKDAELGDIEQLVRDFVGLYQRYKVDITLTFVDPVKDAEAMRKAEIRASREMVVEYGGRSEHLTLLNEQSLTSALLRLAHTKNQELMYLDGHGERKLDGAANHDLGDFGRKLKQNGFQLSSLNLALAQDVPDNGSVLVITQPQIRLLPGEVDKILRYIDNGGNLLWLLDAEPLRGLERLAAKLGILLTPGIITDPDAQKMNAPDNWTLGASYPPHPITRNFNLITAFPYARALGREDSNEHADSEETTNTQWQRRTLVEAAGNGWVSRDPIPKKPRFDKNRDIPGPFSLAIALERSANAREQRIVVVGSGSFLANAYSGNGGNLDLGVNMVNWLAHEEHLITTQPRATLDNSVTLSKTQLGAISIGFVIALPLLLAIVGGVLWWRRRS